MFANFKILAANVRGAGTTSLDKLYHIKRDILDNKVNLTFLSESQIHEAHEELLQVFPPQKFQIYLSPGISNQGALTIVTRCSDYAVELQDLSCDRTNLHAITITELTTKSTFKALGVYASPSYDYNQKLFDVLNDFKPDCTFGDYNSYLDGDSKSSRDR